MIKKVTANHESFRTVEFSPAFNLVLAERTAQATDRDSRNGLGKSLLLEILHFCLGARGSNGHGVMVDSLNDWAFRVDLEEGGERFAFTRHVADPRWVDIDTQAELSVDTKVDDGRTRLKIKEENRLLGQLMFDISDQVADVQYGPSYRSLISYLMRRGPDGFLDPFTHYRNQTRGDKQVNVAFHLGLNWADAAAFEELRIQKKAIDQLGKAAKEGTLPSYLGSEGALEAERVRLRADVDERSEALARFEVRDDYREIEKETNALTEAAHRLVNDNIRDRRFIELYSSRLDEEKEAVISGVEVAELFEEANLEMPEQVQRRLEEVETFHDNVIENRRAYLSEEIARLGQEVEKREGEIAAIDQRKTEFMNVLNSAGALDEYTQRQELLVEVQGRLQDVEARLERLREVTQAKSEWDQRKATVVSRSHTRYEELRAERDRAIAFFNSNTEALYEAPGRLIIDVDDKGFNFDVEIDRADSHGVSNMKIFCFDLMLMQMWSQRDGGPSTLFHDSVIFDGVDGRQVAAALELAHAEANRLGFQYICSLNSDDIPNQDLSDDSPVLQDVAIELRDDDPSGMLLGIEF